MLSCLRSAGFLESTKFRFKKARGIECDHSKWRFPNNPVKTDPLLILVDKAVPETLEEGELRDLPQRFGAVLNIPKEFVAAQLPEFAPFENLVANTIDATCEIEYLLVELHVLF